MHNASGLKKKGGIKRTCGGSGHGHDGTMVACDRHHSATRRTDTGLPSSASQTETGKKSFRHADLNKMILGTGDENATLFA